MTEKNTICSCKTKHSDLNSQLPSEELINKVADFFKVMGDSTRVKILQVLLLEELCVCEIASLLEMSQSAISHQLRVLRQNNLVKKRKSGKTAYYSLADEHVNIISQYAFEHVLEKYIL